MRAMGTPDIITAGGFDLAVYRAGPDVAEADKPPVVLMHGFPEIAYSWRAQMGALAAAGYPVFAPDMPGFGASSAPKGRENYTMEKLTAAMAGMLDHYGIERAVFVSHDWGALVMWQLPFYQGERVLGLAGLNVPLLPHYPMDPMDMFRARFGDKMYIVRFQTEGACEPLLERDMAATFRYFLRKPDENTARPTDIPFAEKSLDLIGHLEKGESAWGGSPLMSDADIQVYVDAYAKNGFTAPLNYYRNMSANWQDQKRFLDGEGNLPKVTVPCLMITAELDRACPPEIAVAMPDMVDDYEQIDLMGCGHWSQQERPDEVNEALLDWMGRHF
ncbi:alpha/beta fold hydrolase [Kordiimonas lipolytica]|uniref:Alpha/beta fold hydrolase n=1 Tax=Kordiimonas lipolytica TaxID=1662421 RepID=A0ABV8U8H5_9PROT|nr:alpha/beta hydrolase [Kordiimonas lipolytica]